MRFKIVDKAKAAEIGITEIIPNAEGIVMLDLSRFQLVGLFLTL